MTKEILQSLMTENFPKLRIQTKYLESSKNTTYSLPHTHAYSTRFIIFRRQKIKEKILKEVRGENPLPVEQQGYESFRNYISKKTVD